MNCHLKKLQRDSNPEPFSHEPTRPQLLANAEVVVYLLGEDSTVSELVQPPPSSVL